MVSEEILDHDRCIKQFVLNVAKNAKFHSSLQKAEMFFAKNVLQNEETGINSLVINKFIFFLFLYLLKYD